MKRAFVLLSLGLLSQSFLQIKHDELIYLERIAFANDSIVSHKTLRFDSYRDDDVYLPKAFISKELSTTADSLLGLRSNKWPSRSEKHILYKIHYKDDEKNNLIKVIVCDLPCDKLDKYFLWASIGHDFEIDDTFNRSWFEE